MATLEKRVTDLEYVIGHLPEDLDARFAGVDVKLAAIREVQALHTMRFTTLEQRIDALELLVEQRLGTMDGRLGAMNGRLGAVELKLGSIESLLRELVQKGS